MTRDEAASWDHYWAHGFLTSCADAFADNYEGAMHRIWESRFAALPNGTRILDICTGNGAIALIAASIARQQNKYFEIDAVDLATIRPERAVAEQARDLLGLVRFHARTDAAATPFADDSFDLVTGHFALEYTDTGRTIAELDRITAADGQAVFVLHHHDSAILETAREEQRHLALLFEETALFDRAREFIGYVGGVDPALRSELGAIPEAEQRRYALNDAAARVTDAVRAAAHPEILRTALGYVSEAYKLLDQDGLDAALQRLEAGEREIRANAARLADLDAAALDRAGIEALAAAFRDNGFAEVGIDTLSDDDSRLIGWVLTAGRGAA